MRTRGQHRTGQRSGAFWDSVEGRAPLPPAAATLGLELIDADAEQSTVEVAFDATEAFTTTRGDVLKGFLAAMLHDTVGPALLCTLEPGEFI
jgi:acyl-coenzyme A thioesterase PaaI-like protein